MIGNSSSGLIEAPAFGIATVNIGDRQSGRLKADSVIDCAPIASEIRDAIGRACSGGFEKIRKNARNPYGSGDASGQILKILKGVDPKKLLKKRFIDLEATAV
jgi:UDP-N-acetylglucosamine 2-epimerase